MAKKKSFKLSTVARDMDLQAWMWSWGMLGLGLGAKYSNGIQRYVFIILLVGVALHIWSMYKVYLKK